MKIADLSTDRAADVLCELSPHIDNIVSDKDIISEIGKVENFKDGITRQGLTAVWIGRISRIVPALLKTHRADVYAILSIINEKSVHEIAKQNIKETIRQVKDTLQDEDLLSFFDLSTPQVATEQSAPSAPSQNSG